MITKTDVLILGLLMDRPMHGYEINQLLQSEGITTWFNLSMASIYYSLNKLKKKGLVIETRHRGERSSEKSVYHLTEQGRRVFFAALEDILGSEERMYFDYDLGIFMLNKLPQQRALPLLEKRLAFLKRWSQSLQESIIQGQQRNQSPLRLAILEHSLACTHMEINWLGNIIQRVRGEERPGEHPALMILSGNLRDFHLPDLIKLIASGGHSGTLTVHDGPIVRTISFHEGRPVCATSQGAEGPVREPQQIMNDIYDLFRWQEGAFVFDQSVGPAEGCLVLRMSAENLILTGARWVDNWATIQRYVPSMDTVFERRDGAVSLEELELTDDERRVLELVDGLRDVTTITRLSELTEFETSKILYGLCAAGLVQPGDLDKIRLRRLFREFAELMCKSTIPYRRAPDDFACEQEVNQRCAEMPIRFRASRIEDHTNPGLRTEELAHLYKTFLTTQFRVIGQHFGEDKAQQFFRQVWDQLGPGLRDIFVKYSFTEITQPEEG